MLGTHIVTRSFTHDAAGNRIQDTRGTIDFDYTINHAGRIAEVEIDTVSSATYVYNGFNQLSERTESVPGGPGGPIHYIYDAQGLLIAEADGTTGDTIREYIWLHGVPLAVVADVNTLSPQIYYVHNDHLGRPIMMTDGTKANVWEATWLPWGEVHSVSGAASLDARLPGQWFQIESGLHYNWHRHYDPTLGRYTQADPLGFVDGPSIYAYAGNSPQMFVDPDGRVFLPPMPGWWDAFKKFFTPAPEYCPLPENDGYNDTLLPSFPGPLLNENADELIELSPDGKVHGDLPDVGEFDGKSEEEVDQAIEDLESSIRQREQEVRRLGEDPAHRRRIDAERRLLRSLRKRLEDRHGR